MRYQDRKRYDEAIEHYRRSAEISRRRLERERREHLERLHDRLALAVLMIAAGLFVLMSVYAFASFGHWLNYGY